MSFYNKRGKKSMLFPPDFIFVGPLAKQTIRKDHTRCRVKSHWLSDSHQHCQKLRMRTLSFESLRTTRHKLMEGRKCRPVCSVIAYPVDCVRKLPLKVYPSKNKEPALCVVCHSKAKGRPFKSVLPAGLGKPGLVTGPGFMEVKIEELEAYLSVHVVLSAIGLHLTGLKICH